MREILFKGKLLSGKGWTFGNLHVDKTGCAIITPDETPIGRYGAVNPDTVCQFTGLTDKNSMKIWEGDVVKGGFLNCTGDWTISNDKSTVTFEHGMFKCGSVSLISFARQCEVVGSIHDKEATE